MERERRPKEVNPERKRAIIGEERKLFEPELLATVGHELRSPLASIKGYADTLLRHEQRLSETERREFLVAIGQASSRLEYVIDRLLEIGQFEQGAVRIDRVPTDVVSLARDAIRAAKQQVAEPGRFSFQMQLRDSSGASTHEVPLVLADPLRLREVLDHLLSNALVYSPLGGRIDVIIHPIQLDGSLQRVASHAKEAVAGFISNSSRIVQREGNGVGQVLEICVCDHGKSIPAKHLDDIFERFYQLDTRLTRESGGLGLGLTLCKYILELHEGLIWAESCPAGGSAFHVWLPLAFAWRARSSGKEQE